MARLFIWCSVKETRALKQDVEICAAPGIVVDLIGGDQVAQARKLGGDKAVRRWLIGK